MCGIFFKAYCSACYFILSLLKKISHGRKQLCTVFKYAMVIHCIKQKWWVYLPVPPAYPGLNKTKDSVSSNYTCVDHYLAYIEAFFQFKIFLKLIDLWLTCTSSFTETENLKMRFLGDIWELHVHKKGFLLLQAVTAQSSSRLWNPINYTLQFILQQHLEKRLLWCKGEQFVS